MSKYTLFGQNIEFEEQADRFFEFQCSAWDSVHYSCKDLSDWYQSKGDIQSVLSGYAKKCQDILITHTIEHLYELLLSIEIYDISKDDILNKYADVDDIIDANNEILSKYQAIVNEQAAASEYRAERMENRGRVSGGGFGVGGALKGMATAGAMNALTGAGHAMVNTVGNIGSAISASSEKSQLFKNKKTLDTLTSGLEDSIIATYNNVKNIVNKYKPNYISSSFNKDKSNTYLENSKNVPEKEKELLIQSFINCPWNESLLEYIFTKYEEERRNILYIGTCYKVDLSDTVEDILKSYYIDDSIETIQSSKKLILNKMTEFGISESETLTQLEYDYLDTVYHHTEMNTDEKLKLIDEYDTDLNIKKDFIYTYKVLELAKKYSVVFSQEELEKIIKYSYHEQAKNSEEAALKAKNYIIWIMNEFGISENETFDNLEKDCVSRLLIGLSTADEQQCNEILNSINNYDALEKNKKTAIDKVNTRISDIWTEEDFNKFSNLYMSQSWFEDNDKNLFIERLESECRIEAVLSILKSAINSFNIENVMAAADYAIAKDKGMLATTFKLNKKAIYNTLTFDSKYIHPEILAYKETINSANKTKKTGFFSGFGSKKDKEARESNVAGVNNSRTKFCTECGTKINIDSKFCPECGSKQ